MITARKWVAAGLGGPEVLRNVEADVPDPGPGQVTIGVRACGMNPADVKHIAPGQDPGLLPLSIGYEVAGIVQALGPDTELASGGGAPGDEVAAQVQVEVSRQLQELGERTSEAITAATQKVIAEFDRFGESLLGKETYWQKASGRRAAARPDTEVVPPGVLPGEEVG